MCFEYLLEVLFVEINVNEPFLALKPWSLMNGDGGHLE